MAYRRNIAKLTKEIAEMEANLHKLEGEHTESK